MARVPQDLQGRVVAVTGAARGIGRATAAACAREGMRVAIGDLDLATAQRTAAELGPAIVALPLDVTRRASVRAFLDAAEDRLGPLDVVVNNAGIMPLGDFTDEDDATAQRMVDVNVNGVLFGMKEALARFRPRGRGHVVNIASSAGKAGYPGGATYCGTKHFVVGLSEAVRLELRGTGIDVTCVMPILANTELSAGLGQARGLKNVEPEDVADAIVDALRTRRADVYVPRILGPLHQLAGALPRSGREAIARAVRADQVLARVDAEARRGYEERAAASDPAHEPDERLSA
jgi:NADP-dependent 3-hydroxy acid dehydrogenase YdfG